MQGRRLSEHVNATIRAELGRRNLSQAKLASLLGITQQALSRRLNGWTAFRIDELDAIAAALDMPTLTLVSTAATAAAEANS